MNKPVSGFTTLFALALSFGLIWLGVHGVDIPKLANAFFGLIILGMALGLVFGFIGSILRR
jgi:hypothetical protein